jgi:hypothetical protein
MPEAIEDTLLEVCFGLLFFAAGAAALLFAAGLALAFETVPLAVAPLPFEAPGLALLLFAPRDAAPPLPLLSAIIPSCSSKSAGASDLLQSACLASGGR